jgi:hypothetical protein
MIIKFILLMVRLSTLIDCISLQILIGHIEIKNIMEK